MACSSGFRPPQFSESQAWLPVWLQQCDVEELSTEGIGKDYVTFEQRVEELKFLKKDEDNGESMKEEGGCNIGKLFVSGTDSTPFSFAQSADNVARFHLCLSSGGYSDNTMATADANLTGSRSLVIRPLQSSPGLYQNDANLSFQNSGIVGHPPTVAVEKSLKENKAVRHERSVNFFDGAADAVELCVAASEALVIKEAVENDSFAQPSASAILEASLQLKQARLGLSSNIHSVKTNEDSEVDNLSDLDDLAMVSAYEDAGIHFSEFLANKLSVSQVNGTFDSEHDENFNQEITSASAIAFGKLCDYRDTQMKQNVVANEMKSRNNVGEVCFDADIRKPVINNLRCSSDIDVGHHYDHVMTVDDRHIPVTGMTITKNKLHDTNVSSTSIVRNQAGEIKNIVKSTDQERFQSRWLGGWTRKNEEQNNIAKYSIPKPFAGETSFFSESADVALDEDSVVQNLDKGNTAASQISIPSENLLNTTKGMPLSQDGVRSSSASLVDPLCSVVPCSISKDACSSPAINYEDAVCHALLRDTLEHEEDKVPETAPFSSAAAEGEKLVMPLDQVKESGDGSRSFSSLRNYRKLLPRHTEFFKRDGHRKKSFSRTAFADCENPAENMPELPILQEVNPPIQPHVVKDRVQCHFDYFDCYMRNLREGNASHTILPKNKVKFLTSQDPQHLLLHGKNSKSFLAPTHADFSEKETSIPGKMKLHKVQTFSKSGCSTRAAKRSTRTSARLELKAQQIDGLWKVSSIMEKKRLIFQNMEFLLTGLSQQKEKEIEGLIRKYGGIVLPHIPSKRGKRSSWFKVPIVLCMKKTQSLKFLFGCAVNAFVLKVNWLIDSIASGLILPPKRYIIIHRNTSKKDDHVCPAYCNTRSLIFNNLGVILHGKAKYFSNIATVIEHGGGQVFKTLQRLIQNLEAGRVSMGIVVTDEENCASRHLKQCALEQNIPITSIYWIIKSLYAGKIIPLEEKRSPRRPRPIKLQMGQDPMDLSQEI